MKWITIEGIEGSGKTYLLNHMKSKIIKGYKIKISTEFPQSNPWKNIIKELGKKDNEFFRNEEPISEMLIFFGVKLANYDKIKKLYKNKKILVLEDRGAFSNIIYGSAIDYLTNGGSFYKKILKFKEIREMISPIQPSILFIDNFDDCINRAEKKRNRRFDKEEINIIKLAYKGFKYLSRIDRKFIIFDRTNLRDDKLISRFERRVSEVI